MQVLIERFFHFDFILFDLVFCAIWTLLLLRRGYRLELAIGVFGICVNFIADYVIWYTIQGVRILEGPVNPILFFIYFSITYGMIEYSYVAAMFKANRNRERLFLTLVLYIGWFASGLASQIIPLNDTIVHVAREMSLYRYPQIFMVIGGYAVLEVLRRKWTPMQGLKPSYLAYLFLVGITVHFGMEFTLWMVGIRPSPLSGVLAEFLFNSFLEFNSGVPILFILWRFFSSRNLGE